MNDRVSTAAAPEPAWSRRVRDHVGGRSVVLVAIAPTQMRAFAEAGAHVRGAIAVLPAGGPAFPAGDPTVLALVGHDHDILAHVVAGYAATIARERAVVEAFLDRVDPRRDAVVASYLPLPHGALGGRNCWTVSSAIAGPLEDKPGARAAFEAAGVDVIESIPRPPGAPSTWWSGVCAELGSPRLVLQADGTHGGGTGTWIVDDPARVPDVPGARIAPYVVGTPINVMGVVTPDGAAVVLPPSVQMLRIDESAHPLYAGNQTGDVVPPTDGRLEAGVRAIGATLAAEGFVGPFGVDAIVTADGRPRFHDLNPRMNGAVDSLRVLMAERHPDAVPLVAALLSCPPWTDAERVSLEEDIADVASSRPLARLWLTTTVAVPRRIDAPPASGSWRVDPDGPRVEHVGGSSWGGDLGVLLPTVPPGMELVAGRRLALGDLLCEPELWDALHDAHGDDTCHRLVEAFLAAPAGGP